MKVDEPKTPYVVYDSEEDAIHGMRAIGGETLPPSALADALSKAVMEVQDEPEIEEESEEEEDILTDEGLQLLVSSFRCLLSSSLLLLHLLLLFSLSCNTLLLRGDRLQSGPRGPCSKRTVCNTTTWQTR